MSVPDPIRRGRAPIGCDRPESAPNPEPGETNPERWEPTHYQSADEWPNWTDEVRVGLADGDDQGDGRDGRRDS